MGAKLSPRLTISKREWFSMTNEQFNALTIMVHAMVVSCIKTNELSQSNYANRASRLKEAERASIDSGKMIEQARKLLVTEPEPREITPPFNPKGS